MKTFTVTLRQHTPLIHFQHDQEEATLRASEVKPKLDKFIVTNLFDDQFEKCKKYLVGYKRLADIARQEKLDERLRQKFEQENFRALAYKMRLIPLGEVENWDMNEPDLDPRTGLPKTKRSASHPRPIVKLKPYPAFFANMDADYENPAEYKRFSYVENIRMQLIFTDEEDTLCEWVKNPGLVSGFFFMHNFGMRSSKGFGSFYPAEDDAMYVPRVSSYAFDFKWNPKISSAGNYKKLFETVDLCHKALRSGIHLKNREGETLFYFKSLLRTYCQDKWGADWGKKKIQDFLSGTGTDPDPDKKYYDVKDLMGFSTQESWRVGYEGSPTIQKSIAIRDADGTWRKATGSEAKALPERMQSPLLFKPIFDKEKRRCTISMKFVSGRVNMREFLASRKVCVSTSNRQAGEVFIDLPPSFKLSEFFAYIFDEAKIDISTYVSEDYHGHSNYRVLQRIFEDIQRNRS